MSQTYLHGIGTRELPSSLLPARTVDTNLPVVFGTAPIDTLDSEKVVYINELRMYSSYVEFVEEMGWSNDFEKYTLCEFVKAYTSLYSAAPFIVCNVFDPTVHQTGGVPDPLKVTSADIIGGIDPDTLKPTGLELVGQVYPKFRLVPGNIQAPKFSAVDPAVAVVIGAKTTNIGGLFTAQGTVDIDVDLVPKYTDVPAYKNDNNLISENLIVCWPKVALGDDVYHLSTHLTGVISVTDADNGYTPHVSPSNKQLQITKVIGAGGKETWLELPHVNYLNGQGIVSVNNMEGLKTWGNRTACYPSNTDPKDAFIPIRRFFNWYRNTFALTYFSKVDGPISRRFIQTILNSEQARLDGFTAQEKILGGRISFLEPENPVIDLMDGLLRFHLYLCPPSPARYIEAIFEYDPYYFQTLYGLAA